MIKTTDDIKQLGSILGVWAHPDDETFSMGGIMAAAVDNGQVVACVTATRGELGIQDETRWPAAQIGAIRTLELEKAYKILGINHHHWLDYADGGCKKVNQGEAVIRIAEYIQMYKPDSVLTFGPDGMTGHEDHCSVSDWASKAVKKAGSRAKLYHVILTEEQYEATVEADKQFNIFFNIDKPPVCKKDTCGIHFELSEKLYQQKLAALKAMESQTEGILKVFEDSLRVSLGTEAFVIAGKE